MDTDMMAEIIGRRLKLWRKQQGRDDEEFAQAAGMVKGTVKRIEGGGRIMMKSLLAYISALGNERAVFRELFDFSPDAIRELKEEEREMENV